MSVLDLFTIAKIYKHLCTFCIFPPYKTLSTGYSMYIFFQTTLTDFERPVNTSLEDSIHMPQNYNNRDRLQTSPSRANAPPANASPETSSPQTWEDAISAYGWDVPGNVRRGRNRLSSTLDDIAEREYPRRDEALRREHEDRSALSRRLRREETLALSHGRGDRSVPAVSVSPIQRPGPVHQVPLAANRGIQSHTFYIPRETHSPILQHVRKIHANKQDGASAAVSRRGGDTRDKQPRVKDVIDDEELIKPQIKKVNAQKCEIPKSSPLPTLESIPDMEATMSDSDWAKPLYAFVNPPLCVLIEKEAAKECDKIAERTGETWMSRNRRASSRELPGHDAMKSHQNAEGVHAEAINSSTSISSDSSEEEDDSVYYSSEDDFEKLELPARNESEHNGARRKWWKGYRL